MVVWIRPGAVRSTDNVSYSCLLVVENLFVSDERMQILTGAETLFCSGLRRKGLMSPGGILFLAECVGVLDRFLSDKEEFTKTCQACFDQYWRPFFRIRKKIGPMVNIEAERHYHG